MRVTIPDLPGRWLIHGASILVALIATRPLAAKTTSVIYAQLLVEQVMLRNRELLAAGIYAVKAGSAGTALVAATTTGAPVKFAATAQTMGGTDHPMGIPLNNAGGYRVILSLEDISTAPIGVLALDFKSVAGQSEESYLEKAREIRSRIREIVPRHDTLFDPYTKGFDDSDTLAQRINNTLVARHPDINVVAIHLTAPGEKLNRVWGINRPDFLGRPSDEIDTDTEQTGRIVMQVIPATHRMEVHMPMLDRKGQLIGTICTVYFWHDEREAGDLYARSLGIRDEARLLMPDNRDDLFKP